jgi:hypothetical protein
MALDPGQRRAKATKDIASRLAALARVLESPPKDGGGGFEPEMVASFLMARAHSLPRSATSTTAGWSAC